MTPSSSPTKASATRDRLVGAAIDVVRKKGFAAISIDDLRRASGVTKGGCFSHFAPKEALGISGTNQWTERAQDLIFTQAPWTRIEGLLGRVPAHINFRLQMIDRPAQGFTCFVGTMAQETCATSDNTRSVCDASITPKPSALRRTSSPRSTDMALPKV